MRIAIIAGRGDFPIQIAKENPNSFVLCVKDHSSPNKFKNNSEIVSLNDPLSWISILKKNKISPDTKQHGTNNARPTPEPQAPPRLLT